MVSIRDIHSYPPGNRILAVSIKRKRVVWFLDCIYFFIKISIFIGISIHFRFFNFQLKRANTHQSDFPAKHISSLPLLIKILQVIPPHNELLAVNGHPTTSPSTVDLGNTTPSGKGKSWNTFENEVDSTVWSGFFVLKLMASSKVFILPVRFTTYILLYMCQILYNLKLF